MTTSRRLAALSLAAALVLGAAACGSSDSGSDGAKDEATTTAAPGDSSSTGDTAATDDTEATEEPSEEGNPGVETLVDGPASEDLTVTWDGTAFSPSELEVAAGEVFTFVAGPDASTSAVTFNGNDTYTITTGLTESFTLEAPGTYTVSEYLTGVTMTVTVTE
jgi:plastocyanin